MAWKRSSVRSRPGPPILLSILPTIMKKAPQFLLQFNVHDIDELAERYGYKEDSEAFLAGKDIKDGNYTRANLKIIVRWKSARRIALLDDNTDEEIARSLRVATDSRTTEKSAIEVLDELRGVGI